MIADLNHRLRTPMAATAASPFKAPFQPPTLPGSGGGGGSDREPPGAMWSPPFSHNSRPRFDDRTSSVFNEFCRIILDYENYNPAENEVFLPKKAKKRIRSRNNRKSSNQDAVQRRRHSSSPLGSTGSSNESFQTRGDDDSDEQRDLINDSEDLITCYCNRPYAGRPMVECDNCLTWIHITCTSLKRSDRVPDVWYCDKCKDEFSSSSCDQQSPQTVAATGSARRKSGSSKRKRSAGKSTTSLANFNGKMAKVSPVSS